MKESLNSKAGIIIGIPVRMGSTRFPGKALCSILGVPMVEHVWRRCLLASVVDRVFIATCDEELKQWGEKVGAEVVMTPKDIERPGLRVSEAAKSLGIPNDDIVAIVQGDEPLIHPDCIAIGAQPLIEDPNLFCTNYCARADEKEWLDWDEVKVVTDLEMNLIYLSRSPIPSDTVGQTGPRMKQLGIFFFRMKHLLEFQQLAPTRLERVESIELIRALEHRRQIRMINYPYLIKSVDNESQRQEVEMLMRNDLIWPLYKEECNVGD